MDGIQIKKLGLVTFEGGATAFGGVATFGGSLLSGFTCGHKKLTLISGGGEVLLSGRRYYRNFTVTFWISIFRKLKTLGPWRHSTNRLIFVLQGGT